MAPAELSNTERTKIRRSAHRARSDRAALCDVLDAGLICHLGLCVDGAPRVLPTAYCRLGETLYLHGSTGARSLREAQQSTEVCVTVTHLDGVVYARSAFHSSMNYRSAMVHGRSRNVTDPDEHRAALRAITEHLAPGAWDHARRPTKRELAATAVIALDLTEAAVKIREGGPGDDEEDIATSRAWAGVLPLHQAWGTPQASPDLAEDIGLPEHIAARTSATPGVPG